MEKYNGWTNWDTCNAHLWLTNDEGAYNVAINTLSPETLVKEFHSLFFSEISKRYIDDININKVNWVEIYKNLKS